MKLAPPAARIIVIGFIALAYGSLLQAKAVARHSSGVTYDAVLVDALAVAAHRPNLSVVRVAGESMLPYFSDEAVLVVKKIEAARLRPGMTVVYLNRFGEKVAHRVIARVEGGWQVKGYNNDRPDSTVVNGENLLGVVYATFYSVGRPKVELAATDLPSVETVLAAPAK